MENNIEEYTKKPITIQAIQFDGRDKKSIENFIGKELKAELESETAYIAGIAPPIFSVIIPTLEGNMKAMKGDYIIKGIKGEYYPCKPDIFQASYTPKQPDKVVMSAEDLIGEWFDIEIGDVGDIRASTMHNINLQHLIDGFKKYSQYVLSERGLFSEDDMYQVWREHYGDGYPDKFDEFLTNYKKSKK